MRLLFKTGKKLFSYKKKEDLSSFSLAELCDRVVKCCNSFDDMAELIEDKGFSECVTGDSEATFKRLEALSLFFEQIQNKNDEQVKNLADIYLLIGDLYQYVEDFDRSTCWYRKAMLVDDRYDIPYHSCAISYLSLNQTEQAIKCLEHEITVAPGNYYTYLLLADLYERLSEFEMVELVLKMLLARDAENIQGLHRLILHYGANRKDLDVSLLVKRIVAASKQLVKKDLILWTYYMCQQEQHAEALAFLEERAKESTEISITHLLKAHIYGLQHQYTCKHRELVLFVNLNQGREEFMRTRIEEFASVFGRKAAESIQKKVCAPYCSGINRRKTEI